MFNFFKLNTIENNLTESTLLKFFCTLNFFFYKVFDISVPYVLIAFEKETRILSDLNQIFLINYVKIHLY